MNCNELRERIVEGASGLQTPGTASSQHLAQCAECREFLAFSDLFDAEMARSFQDRHPSPAFSNRLEARLQHEILAPRIRAQQLMDEARQLDDSLALEYRKPFTQFLRAHVLDILGGGAVALLAVNLLPSFVGGSPNAPLGQAAAQMGLLATTSSPWLFAGLALSAAVLGVNRLRFSAE